VSRFIARMRVAPLFRGRSAAIVLAVAAAAQPAAAGEDCNQNGVPDSLDIRPLIDFGLATSNYGALLSTAADAGDVNGDGAIDVVAISNNDSFSVLLNRGDGNFAYPVRYVAGDRPVGIALGDFDNDADLDLAVASRDDDAVRIYRNNGLGVFTHVGTLSYLFGTDVRGLGAGHLNADTHIDLIVIFEAGIYVEFGQGGNTFSAWAGGIRAAGTLPVSAIAADLNNDGDRELIVANTTSDNVSVFTNNGDDTFAGPTHYLVGDAPRGLAAADLTGDGYADLAVTGSGDDSLRLWINGGTAAGTFVSSSTLAVGDQPFSVAAVNVDGDADTDLAVLHSRDGTAMILRNNGAGAFTATGSYASGSFGNTLLPADFDGDGDPDLAANTTGAVVTVLRNDGTGAFPPRPTRLTLGNGAFAVAAADLVDDPQPDLAVTNVAASTVTIVRNNGGMLTVATWFPTADEPFDLAVGHLNADGRLDVAAACISGGAVTVALDNGVGGYATMDYPFGSEMTDVAILDFDGDLDSDIAATWAGDYDNGCACYINGGIYLLENDGSGGFSVLSLLPAPAGTVGVAVGYFNNDALPDLVAVGQDAVDVAVYMGLGAGAFAPAASYPHATLLYDVTVADFNGDGRDDFASLRFDLSDFVADGLGVRLNNGDGTFGPLALYSGVNGLKLTSDDLNGDGSVDIVASDSGTDALAVFSNRGDGTFDDSVSWLTIDAAAGMAAADFDGDGKVDVANAGFGVTGELALLINRSLPASADTNGNGVPDECENPCPGDVDGNGIVDLSDLTVLLANFGTISGANPEDGDTDGDGDVDLTDLATLLGVFGTTCP